MLHIFKVTDDKLTIDNMSLGRLSVVAGKAWYVDGTNGSDSRSGRSWTKAFATIGKAIASASALDSIFIRPQKVAAGGTDPVSYAEALTIGPTLFGLRLIGVADGAAQGNLPQIKKGSGTAPLLTIQAPGCYISGLGFNGSGSTGGGILLDDDGATKTAFGTVVENCHIKNCTVTANNSTAGGGIYWSANGGAWQVRIVRNRFYMNTGSISLLGTGNDRPKDIVIAHNVFGADAAATADSYIYGAGGSGFVDVTIHDNVFGADVPTGGGAGSVARYMDLTGVAQGLVSHNYFACTGKTFGAAGNAAKIPTTVMICGNYQDNALIGRT